MKRHIVAVLGLLLGSFHGIAADNQPHEEGIESKEYVWNEMRGEKLLALQTKGDAARGEIAFEICQGCHRPGAQGRPDGTYPRLAGQHASVLIKQMTDVRAGRRDNPKMYPFANQHALSVQDVADIAAFLQALPVPERNGRGPGTDVDKGAKLYEKDCRSCHGDKGEGSAAKFYPKVANQHYKYLLREAISIRDGERRNANPEMVKVIKGYSNEDMEAVSDYISRLAAK